MDWAFRKGDTGAGMIRRFWESIEAPLAAREVTQRPAVQTDLHVAHPGKGIRKEGLDGVPRYRW